MNLSMLQPVSALVQKYGIKAIVYGAPGTGKTPFLMSAPNPVHAFSEPGLRSVSESMHPGYIIDSYAKQLDYVTWACGSQEARQFEVKTFDSFTQIAEIILEEESRDNKNPNPKSWYGEMSKKVMKLLNMIYFAPALHAVMICKEGMIELPDGNKRFGPFFPGQDLGIKVPHLFDSVWRMESVKDAKQVQHQVVRTQGNFTAIARDRNGRKNPQTGSWEPNLAELEHADLTYLIRKAFQ